MKIYLKITKHKYLRNYFINYLKINNKLINKYNKTRLHLRNK